MMEHPATFDDGKTSIQFPEFENVRLAEGDVGNTEPFRHARGIGQTRQAQINGKNLPLGACPCHFNRMVAGAASGDQYGHRAWTNTKPPAWTTPQRQFLDR